LRTRIVGKFIVCVLIFWVVGCVIIPISIRKRLNRWFFEVHAPTQTGITTLRRLQNFWALRSESKLKLMTYCRDLARENAFLKLKILEQAEQVRHCQQILRLNKLPSSEKFQYLVARVCRRCVDTWAQYLVIDRGVGDGIQIGQGVICSQGIVGRIAEVYVNSSTVELVSSPKFRLLVHFEDKKEPLLLQGTYNPPFSPKRAHLLNLKGLCPEPRKIVTTSLGQQFPANIFVGQLTKVTRKKDWIGKVQLGDYLMWLEEVSVLIPVVPES
jgi:rod shape-determining protein MreC